ncbi:right-handed parallel beta-helix repeat-containing protein [Myxococcota bacterium]|nr:right-handed parallel beta-helix repeat-containing protein [Myxococcota bacterium]
MSLRPPAPLALPLLLIWGCSAGWQAGGRAPSDAGDPGTAGSGAGAPWGSDTPAETGASGGDTAAPDSGAAGEAADTLVLHLSPDGDDAADGQDPARPLRSLEGARLRVLALDPTGPVDIRIAPGTYRCAGAAEAWTWTHGQPLRIGPDREVPGPARDHALHPDRPVFEGRDEAGEPCDDSVWLQVQHAGEPLPLTVEGLSITRYRGGITVKAADGVQADPDLGVVLHNLVFQRIGDRYHTRWHDDGTWLEGKGAVLLTRSSGITISDCWFDQVRNREGSEGLVHAIYFTSHASRCRVQGNTFHGTSGAMVKLTDFSNDNEFLDNHLSYGPHGLRDRWCGAREDPTTACDGQAQCPSWGNRFPYERNSWGHIDAGAPVTVLEVPEGQRCAHAPPADGVRMDLGEGGIIYGP